ncbi:MAG: carbonic anhydrase [Planctomycetota bacterium]
MSPRDALQRLIDGNARFVAGESQFVGIDQIRRCDTFLGEQPAALVLTCGDSRVAPEFVFDVGLGELFTLRNAGNVVTDSVLGSAEYAVTYLDTPVLVVMGQTHCSAVAAVAYAGDDHEHASMPRHFAGMLEQIRPVVDALGGPKPGDEELLANAIEGNVYQSMSHLLTRSPEIRLAVEEGRTAVVGAVYDTHLGQVTWLGRHPQESTLLQTPVEAIPGAVAEGDGEEGQLEVATGAHPAEAEEDQVMVEIGTEPIGNH